MLAGGGVPGIRKKNTYFLYRVGGYYIVNGTISVLGDEMTLDTLSARFRENDAFLAYHSIMYIF